VSLDPMLQSPSTPAELPTTTTLPTTAAVCRELLNTCLQLYTSQPTGQHKPSDLNPCGLIG